MRLNTRMVRSLIGASLATVVLAMLAACGSDPTATPKPTATAVPQAAPTATPNAAAAFEAEWAALATAAKAEGKLTIAAGGSGARDSRPVWDVFQEQYGIEVLITTGKSNDVLQRLLAEQSSNVYEVDLFMMDIGKQLQVIDAKGLRPVEPLLVHPEVTDMSLWYNNQYLWADVDRKYVIGYAATIDRDAIVTAGYNTDLVPEEDIANITVDTDFMAPWMIDKYKGKVLMMAPPPYSTAGGGAYYTVSKHPSLGLEWLDGFMRAYDAEWEVDNRRGCDAIAQGKYAWVFFGSTLNACLIELGNDGLPTAEFKIKAGPGQEPFMSGGSSAMQISSPIQPPHPNATKLALNWLLSIDGQTANNEFANTREGRYPRPSLRNDVPPGKTNPAQRRDPGVFYDLCIECNPDEYEESLEIHAFAAGVYEELTGIR